MRLSEGNPFRTCANPQARNLFTQPSKPLWERNGLNISRFKLFRRISVTIFWFTETILQGEIIYAPPPSPHLWLKGIFQGRGVGVYILRPHAAGILYAPPFYTPPTPRRVFSGVGGWGCIKLGPVNSEIVFCKAGNQIFVPVLAGGLFFFSPLGPYDLPGKQQTRSYQWIFGP